MELNNMMEVIIDDLNEVFDGMLVAEFKNDLLILTLSTRKHVEPWQLDEQLSGALEYVIDGSMNFYILNAVYLSTLYLVQFSSILKLSNLSINSLEPTSVISKPKSLSTANATS